MPGFRWDDKLRPKLEGAKERFPAGCMMLAHSEAQRLKATMQLNRKWTDRSGEAKRQLSARVSKPSSNVIRITLSHGVDYGKYLEFAHGKRYAIIEPTINSEKDAVMAKFTALYYSVFT